MTDHDLDNHELTRRAVHVDRIHPGSVWDNIFKEEHEVT